MEDSILLIADPPALKPLLEATATSGGSTATLRAIVTKILSHPAIYCGFDQVKESIALAKKDDGAAADSQLLVTLDLFSYGTVADYLTAESSKQCLTLNDTQVFKLRQLTIVSAIQEACHRGDKAVSYSSLQAAVVLKPADGAMDNDEDAARHCRLLEQLLTASMYAGLIQGKLCHKTQRFLLGKVPPCCARDVPANNVADLLQSLKGLGQRLNEAHGELQVAQDGVEDSLQQATNHWKKVLDSTPSYHASSAGRGGRAARSSARHLKRSRGGGGAMEGFASYLA